jgi:hypothetical protein
VNTILFANHEALIEETSLQEAYELVAPELDGLAPSEVQIINLDIPSSVAMVLGVLERLRAQREALATLPGFDLERFDKLETYAQALTYAQRLHLIATQPADQLPAFQVEASTIRELLYKDASVAVARGWIAPESLNDLKGANGYKNTASDIQILVGVLQVNAAKIQGRMGATEAELEYAEKLAFHLLRSYGVKKNGTEGPAETADRRQRAFTLLFRTYDEARQGIAYIRRAFGDADRLAPSLFTARATKRKGDVDAAAEVIDESEATVLGLGTPGAPAVGTAQAAGSAQSAGAAQEVSDPFAK